MAKGRKDDDVLAPLCFSCSSPPPPSAAGTTPRREGLRPTPDDTCPIIGSGRHRDDGDTEPVPLTSHRAETGKSNKGIGKRGNDVELARTSPENGCTNGRSGSLPGLVRPSLPCL